MEDTLMLLCDIGNTSLHFFDGINDYKKDVEHFDSLSIKEEVFYICVNPRLKEIVKLLKNWQDLSLHVDMKKYYETMGIDRIMACEAVHDGIIVDAGSAVTVDIVEDGIYKGGFIYPGKFAMQKTYKDISTALDYSFNFEVSLDKMPKNSQDSISYGYLKTLYAEVMSHNKEIILTGGDADEFAKIFPSAKVDKKLIFIGMNTILKKADIC
jgi:type III pantothenate kinase